jgi:hypothetical protein
LKVIAEINFYIVLGELFLVQEHIFNLERSELINGDWLEKDYFKFSGISGNGEFKEGKMFGYSLYSLRWQNSKRNDMVRDSSLNLHKYIYFKKKRSRYEDEKVIGKKKMVCCNKEVNNGFEQ